MGLRGSQNPKCVQIKENKGFHAKTHENYFSLNQTQEEKGQDAELTKISKRIIPHQTDKSGKI